MAKIIVVDGNSIMNRAFYGLSGRNMLLNKAGIPTNALFGFLNILLKLINEDKPTHIAVAFDLRVPTFRHKKYAEYKANRKGMPDELATQMPIIKEILTAMNIKIIEKEGFEADDIIGTLAKRAKKEEFEVVIFTGDRDSFQLIDENIHVKLPSTKGGKTETEEYDEGKIAEKYGLKPIDLIQVKALMGDASDNIPGVHGIGEKTAISYIQKFLTLENIYENIDDASIRPRVKELLTTYREDAFMSRELGTIDINVPIDIELSELEVKKYDEDKLYEIFEKLEFNNFIKRLGLESKNKNAVTIDVGKYDILIKIDDLKNRLKEVKSVSLFIDDIEKKEKIDKIAFCIDRENAFILELAGDTLEKLKWIFEESNIEIISYNTKNLYLLLKKYEVTIKNLKSDVSIAKYVLNPTYGDYLLNTMSSNEINIDLNNLGAKTTTQISMFNSDTNNDDLIMSAKVIYELNNKFMKEIEENGQSKLFYEIEMPLIEVLADMQNTGIMVEEESLKEYSDHLAEKVDVLTKEIIELAGEEFNINSPKQIGDILFGKLGLKAGKMTQRGYATDAETLEKLKNEHPIVNKILEYKQYMKLKSTYADGLRNVIDKETGRIHSNFNQTVTATGRLSSTEPNLQNIPIKIEAGKLIRKMFVAKDGYKFIDADYSQIELRVLAAMSGDEVMINAFNNDEDVHTSTAMQIFHLPYEEVTPALRAKAKAVNFGIVYGQSDFTLSEDLNISKKEAKEYIESYFEHFPKIKEFMNSLIENGEQKGYVETLFTRRRYLPELKSSNFHVRSFAKRAAMNMPIQGSAADIIKIAMIQVYNKLKGKKSKLVLQVHDELIIEASEDEIEEVSQIVRKSMEEAVKLDVKLNVDLNVGKSWLDAK